ncbi:ATP synthase subunit d, mitochondrial [Habropoda laboriosa]|uniref:ATP synthase subunit d, mitochondrial n=1 Tax=Habropoda laboriosa TaxID=597456 RepID=A0A0L7RCX8_9HYME|nr:PREDICTED: ATP synthase subunit d, mitochondrial-like [Habropoda laboriosa]KOC68708.1 ATP synthase subunit d, mitochondrial [Habropoda laboriosa]
MSRRALKAINWAAFAERIPESEKTTLSAFKSKSDKFLQRMMANPEALPKIDWTYYKKTIATPGLVDKFQKEYESISIPYPVDKYTAEIDNAQKETAKKIEQFIEETNATISSMEKEINKLKAMLPYAEMTMDDFIEAHPKAFMRTDVVTTWPHTDDSQEDLNDDTPDENDH